MKSEAHIKIAHSYYSKIADTLLEFLREEDVLEEGTYAREQISLLHSKFRNMELTLEFVMPELKETQS